MTHKQSLGQQVKHLFSLCVEAQPEQQSKIIEDSHFSHEVKQRVASLLNYQHEEYQLTKSIAESAQNELGVSSIKAGTLIEQYQLLREIGEGGQGEVWLAGRNDGEFTHRVAIKLIKFSHNQKDLQRFQTERELLASLQHANIAALYGGGKIDDRLYMIMEWIDGVPLIKYAKHESLNLSQTLNLFIQICHAVRFAHSKGIIHRDIKPSNILVTKEGIVKLLDFGIAKTIDADVTQTQSAAMITLAYSSPEQINGDVVSTATDVYALGLLLYELLTSQRAQNHTTESAADYIRLISEVTPVKPSLAEANCHKKFSSKKLQGDLDNLVMMAIRKEPERRYKSVDALITDVENYLQSKPLVASGDSIGYKAKKLLKRNPLASLLTTVVFAFIIGLAIFMYQANIKLNIQSQIAIKQATIANEQAEIANATSDFITTLLKSATPLANKGEDLNLRDVMQQGERQLISGSVKHPKVQVKLYSLFASIQHNLENNPKAIQYYQKAADISEQLGDYEAQLRALGQLAVMYFFNNEVENGNKAFELADAISLKVTDVVELAWYKVRKSTNEYKKGNYQLALDLAQSALDEMKLNQIDNPEILGRIYNEMAIAVSEFDMQKSLPLRDKAIQYAKIFYGKTHPVYASRLGSKVYNLLKLNRSTEAAIILEEAMLIAEKLFTKEHPEYAFLLAKVSEIKHIQGEYNQAVEVRKKANKLNKHFFGEFSFNNAFGIDKLAEIYEDNGEYQNAKELYQQAINIRKTLDKNNHIRIATPQKNLARLLVKMGDYQKAHDLIEHVIEVYEDNKKDNLYNHIVKAAAFIGNSDDSIQCQVGLQQIVDLTPRLNKKPENSWKRMLTEIWIGELAMECGNTDMAKTFLKVGLDKSKSIYKLDSVGQKLIAKKVNALLKNK